MQQASDVNSGRYPDDILRTYNDSQSIDTTGLVPKFIVIYIWCSFYVILITV